MSTLFCCFFCGLVRPRTPVWYRPKHGGRCTDSCGRDVIDHMAHGRRLSVCLSVPVMSPNCAMAASYTEMMIDDDDDGDDYEKKTVHGTILNGTAKKEKEGKEEEEGKREAADNNHSLQLKRKANG